MRCRTSAAATSRNRVSSCASGGIGAAYFRVSGRTFNSQDLLGRCRTKGTQHLATLGALTDYDRNKEEAEKAWTWERWQGTYDWITASVRRVGSGQHRWHLDQLVIVRDDERVRCGYVTRVALDSHGDLAVTLKLWAGAPTAIAVRGLTTMLVEETPFPDGPAGRDAGREGEPARPAAHLQRRPRAALARVRARSAASG